MQKKRSIGVMAVGIYATIMGLLRFITLLITFIIPLLLLYPDKLTWQNVTHIFTLTVQEIQKHTTLFQLTISQLLSFGILISGVGILLLKDWARKLFIGLSIIICSLMSFNLFFQRKISIFDIIENFIYIALIYFLTRPKVKERFR